MSYGSDHMASATGYGHPSQIARPSANQLKTSDVDTLPTVKRSSRGHRLSMLPRPNIGSTASPTTPVSAASSQNSTQRSFSSVSSPETNPSLFVAGQQLPLKRVRNVLRRRAPTIGQHVEQSQSNKLSLVIPQGSQDNMNNVPAYQPAPTSPTQSATPYNPSQKNNSNATLDSASSKYSGPKELASLRTTVDTQNLPPPPTPFFSASSPSTRYSVSPSVWSRGSTPTSLSSYSPGIVHPTKIGRLRQPSPSQTRLPVFSPPVHPSPRQEKPEVKIGNQPNTTKPESRPVRGINAGKLKQTRSGSVDTRDPHVPAASNHPFSPSSPEVADIDVAKARREVEEAERRLFDPQGVTESPARAAEPPQTPPRPSRDGTHRLELETSPVVQSNLRYIRSTGHTRRESIEKVLASQRPTPTPNQSAAASIDSLHSRGLSQIPSRDGVSPILSRKSPRTLTKEAPKEVTEPKIPVSKRFGLFSKKSKPDLAEAATEPRLPRKGPTAGTGHEGYGKYGQRGRKASGSSSSGTRTRSTSTTRSAASKGSQSSLPELEIDDFLMSRLEPVIINGGGMDGASLSRTQSEQSMSSVSVASVSTLPRQPLSYSTAPSTDSLATSTETSGETLTPDQFDRMARNKSPERQPRTGGRVNTSKSRMPVPKGKKHGVFSNPQASATSTSLSSQQSSTVAPSIAAPSQPSRIVQQSPKKPAKAVKAEPQHAKKEKTSMWSFFQKSRSPEQKTAPPVTAPPTARLHAAIKPVLNTRPIAHYALVDTDSDELDEIIKNIEDSPPTEDEEVLKPVEVPRGLNIRKREPSILLPSPPKMHSEFEKDDRPSPRTAMFNRNLMPPEPEKSPEQRPRRLASIGRIPQVVSRRDRHHRPAMQSFSRPFSGIETPALTVPTTETMRESPLLVNATPNVQMPFAPGFAPNESPEWGRGFNPTFSAAEDTSALEFLAGPFSTYEFLQFPPKKDSTSSESSGALAAVTAVAPVPGSPPTEDEVWNEFDDLIDHVLSPDKPTPKPEETNKDDETDRFELATMASRALQDGLNSVQPQSVPGGTSVRSSASSVHLRRSRIVSALQSSTAPSSQPSYSDLAAPYGHLNDEMDDLTESTEPSSTTEKRRENQSTFLNSLAAVPSPRPKVHRQQEPGSSEHEWDAVTSTNMRSASMMTSRWLSFGRVLFSPAQNHVKAGAQGRILVIDGLGNDDWSFYCSLTYPDAEIYSLSGPPVSTSAPHPAAWQPPTNHHTVYHAGLGNPLPFPKDYFTVVVLRFPTVCSEAVQGNIVQECKRVLRTGGYLEMTLLDRDMVNMGPQTRKAIRQLKEMTCLSDSTLCLKPTSDSIQREIGAQGFDSLRRCIVRIPVAGVVLRSSDSSSSTHSFSTPSTAFPIPTISITNPGTNPVPTYQSPDANISLGDLLSDPSPSPANDESIAKIVARVGRWWYSKCYEDPISHPRSIWDDRKLLRECQKRGTGFRMFIAYAQKPSQVPRRTANLITLISLPFPLLPSDLPHNSTPNLKMPLFDGEQLDTIGRHPVLYKYSPANDASKPLIAFVPGMAHNARISYGGHQNSRNEDFLSYWFNHYGYGFLGISYPIDAEQPIMPATSPDFTIPEWGQQAAAIINTVITEHNLARKVVILAWSMAGKILHPVSVQTRRLGIEVELFVSLAATPALPGIQPVVSKGDLVKTPAGYATKPELETRFLEQLDEQTYLNRHPDKIDGITPIIDADTYRRDYLGATPIGLTASGLHYDSDTSDFVEDDRLQFLKDGQAHDFENLPWMAAICPTSRLDFRHALTDKATWGYLMVQRATSKFIIDGIANFYHNDGPLELAFFELQKAILRIPDLMTMDIRGTHFFFVGVNGARNTVESVVELLDNLASIEEGIKNINHKLTLLQGRSR
ncbi:unnamed protein product [Penicillium salamii]|uniref:Methyltransferase type 11 domain-containing protein n=1 Tax=Penicillium salamii TaxID=1612424 RepID=A0A9W4NKG7_9EURO|nr:unnamed protein product [Penicillium salamii]CAG7974510.1 unnamed protein product [Penicillium salamii]CAG8032561.1 unnamed protein product [Penicillium salamii]CAG8059249.1 unnamed protein product [Penicillium salamii]CAG8145128.1 unnamed protein product [Penicillium salamii]